MFMKVACILIRMHCTFVCRTDGIHLFNCLVRHLRHAPACASHAPAMGGGKRTLQLKPHRGLHAAGFSSPSPLHHLRPRNVLFDLVHESFHFLQMKRAGKAVSNPHEGFAGMQFTMQSKLAHGRETAHLRNGTNASMTNACAPLKLDT